VAGQAKASDKIADAQDKAIGGIEKGYAKIEEAGARRADAIAKWTDAEQEARYGYSVRSQYPAAYAWDDGSRGSSKGNGPRSTRAPRGTPPRLGSIAAGTTPASRSDGRAPKD
jgi:hypothetical protein